MAPAMTAPAVTDLVAAGTAALDEGDWGRAHAGLTEAVQSAGGGAPETWEALNLAELPDAAIDAIVEHGRTLPKGASQLAMFCWGGAVARVPAGATPLSGRDARWVIDPLLLWESAGEDAAALAHGRAYRDLLAPWAAGAAYGNFIGSEGQARIRAGYRPGDYERLAEIKAVWDPRNVFCANQNIVPAA
jgi:hypothetical protein